LTDTDTLPANTVRLCPAADVPPGEIRKGALPDGTCVAIYNLDGRIYATADRCTHGDASLSEEGTIVGDQVECSFHFGCFDIATGKAVAMPCTEALRVYPVTIIDGFIHVAI
jgi:p-cumate 2,3-dioxygenase ferredoxin subunit